MHHLRYTEDELEDEASMWRGVTDSNSGKTYYYHVVTRESTWEKPFALCSAQERALVVRREEQQRNFFAEMEDNIRRKMKQGHFFADDMGVPHPQVQHPEEVGSSKRPAASLCRTISTMDESVVAQLNAAVSPLSSRSSSSDLDMMASPHPSPLGIASPQFSNSAMCPPVLHALGWPNGGVRPISTNCEDVRPLVAAGEGAIVSEAATTSSRRFHQSPGDNLLIGGVPTAGKITSSTSSGGTDFMSGTSASGRPCATRKASAVTDDGLGSAVSQSGRRVPLSLMRRNSTSTIYLSPHDTLSHPDLDAAIRCVCAVFRAHMIEAPVDEDEDEKDDLGGDGGGYRAGLAGSDSQRYSLESIDGRDNSLQAEYVSVFNDPPPVETELQDIPSLDKLRRSSAERAAEEDRLVAAHGELTIDADAGAGTRASVGEDTRGEGVKDGDIPTLREITKYFRDLYHRTNLKFDCVVLSLIYVEHLMKETRGALRPRPSNWKSLLMSVLLLSSKVWDDNSMWNGDFCELCPSFTLVRLNQLEVTVLEVLGYNVRVLSSEYAKYYFHLRSMCVRGGLSEDHTPVHPLDMENVKVLEDLSSKLALRSVGRLDRSMKAHTLHSFHDSKLLQKVASQGYAFTDRQAPAVSLEQVVHTMRP